MHEALVDLTCFVTSIRWAIRGEMSVKPALLSIPCIGVGVLCYSGRQFHVSQELLRKLEELLRKMKDVPKEDS